MPENCAPYPRRRRLLMLPLLLVLVLVLVLVISLFLATVHIIDRLSVPEQADSTQRAQKTRSFAEGAKFYG